MALEIETKFKIGNAEDARVRLARIGARSSSKELEKDVYYAGPELASVLTVRLRTVSSKALFTIKSAAETSADASPGMKVLEETQIIIDDASTFGRMLELMGFVPQFRKEKVRETYLWRGIPIFLDELPYLGFFLEIEASEDEIKAAVSALGLDIKTAIGETYMQLFARFKAARGEPDLELVFR